MVKGIAEMTTLKKQNKRLQDKMAQLRQMCDKHQSEGQTTLAVGTITAVLCWTDAKNAVK